MILNPMIASEDFGSIVPPDDASDFDGTQSEAISKHHDMMGEVLRDFNKQAESLRLKSKKRNEDIRSSQKRKQNSISREEFSSKVSKVFR